MKNASDWFMSRLATAEERISKFENIPLENSLTEIQRVKEIKKRKNKISRNRKSVLISITYICEIPEDKQRKKHKKYFE